MISRNFLLRDNVSQDRDSPPAPASTTRRNGKPQHGVLPLNSNCLPSRLSSRHRDFAVLKFGSIARSDSIRRDQQELLGDLVRHALIIVGDLLTQAGDGLVVIAEAEQNVAGRNRGGEGAA